MDTGSDKIRVLNLKIKLGLVAGILACVFLIVGLIGTVMFVKRSIVSEKKANKQLQQITGYGTIVEQKPAQPIKATAEGQIMKMFVKGGQKVKAGQNLLLLCTNYSLIGGPVYNYDLPRSGGMAILPPLPATASLPSFSSVESASGQTLTELQVKYAEAAKKLGQKKLAFDMAENGYADYQKLLNQGIVTQLEIQEYESKLAKAKSDYETAESETASIKARIEEAKQAKSVVYSNDVSLSQFKKISYKLPRRLPRIRVSRKTAVITAPADGFVKVQNKYKRGDIVTNDKEVFQLFPIYQSYVAEVKVQGQNLSGLHLQQRVTLKVQGFPAVIHGTVQAINPASVDGVASHQAYIVKIKPEKGSVKVAGKVYDLKSGMKILAIF